MSQRATLLWGAVLGGLGVALGAIGAHAFRRMLLANGRIETFEIAVRYHVVHALALLMAGVLMAQVQNKTLRWAASCWVGGILLFSGSLYALSFTSMSAFAFLTPAGGLLFLAGWAFLVTAVLKNK